MGVPGFLKPTKKKLIILAVIIIAALVGFNFYNRPGQDSLELTEVKRQEIKSIVSSSGSLTGKNSADLKFKIPGKLTFINVKTGDTVFAGQVLAGLDTQQLAIELQQAQNILRDKQATTDTVVDDIHLFQYGNGGFSNVGTENETMTQRQLRTTAEVARDNAFDAIKQVQRGFQDTVIISPLSGLVTQAVEVPNQAVSITDLIVQVVDTTAVYFDTDIDEADISKIRVGLSAEVILDAYPEDVFNGTVDRIQPQTKTTSQGAKIVTIRIRLNNIPATFINGLTGQASIVIESVKGSLTIPLEALRDDNTVLVQEGKNLTVRKVTPGIMSDTDVEIKEGLREGEKVQLNPPPSGQ
ncbi:MAG: efflux RND transporter periplasmic adaptor subunit [Candidatus Daviesbacteria bacterium]|nr:efflux RND transporter periplasmic adaptor subunit [Candidatus Daviesbacteria bacterium]